MDAAQLTHLITTGTPVSLIVEAIRWPHQQLIRRWDLARWREANIPGAILLWRVAEADARTPAQLAVGQRLAQLASDKRAAEAEARRHDGRSWTGLGLAAQQRANRLAAEIAEVQLLPDAPPEIRRERLAGELRRLRQHLDQVRTWRREYGDADAARLGDDEPTTAAAIAARTAELDALPVPTPVAGLLLVDADESRRAEYTATAARAGYPTTVLMRGQWMPGPARTVADAILDGVAH